MSNKDQQISALIRRIDSLTLEANSLTRELQGLMNQQPVRNENSNDFQIGDSVVITNNYLGQRGTTGIITHITPKRITLRNEATGREYTRKNSNVRREATIR
jgi:hypothetical protein